MAAATAWKAYDLFKLNVGKKLVDLSTDTIKCALFSSASNANTSSVSPATFATLTNELATANGYTAGGVTIAPTWTNAAGTETFDVADATWTPTGPITARYAVLYASVSGYLIAWTLLDSAPADVNVASITINASGVFSLT